MLLFDRTRILESIEAGVATGFTVTAEGQPLVADYSTGNFGVKPAAASETDVFYGTSFSQQLTLVALPMYETVTPVAGGTVNLSRGMIYTSAIVVPGFTVVSGAPGGAAEVQLNEVNGTLTFHSGASTTAVTVRYRYQPTALEINTVQGMNPAGGSAQFVTDTVGVVRKGHVYTTEFDVNIDWATLTSGGSYVVGVKNSLYVAYVDDAARIAANAALVPGAVIVNVPAIGFGGSGYGSNAFLGLAY